MYSLIVSGMRGAWDERYFSLDQHRFLEHTEEAVAQRYRTLDENIVAELKRIPTVFAYERGRGDARVGWITDLRIRQGEIRISFQFDNAIAPFTTDDLEGHMWEFDINKYEMYRTHWALKEVDVFEALRESGVGGNLTRAPGVAIPPYLETGIRPIRGGEVVGEVVEVQPTVFRKPQDAPQRDLVAVMMPFERAFDDVYAAVEAACGAANLRAQRADNMWEDSTIIQDVFSLLYRSRIVVVDFSGRNPNVFYETGIAHTLGRPVVPITQSADDVPFDLRHHRYQRYHPNAEGLRDLTEKLIPRLTSLGR